MTYTEGTDRYSWFRLRSGFRQLEIPPGKINLVTQGSTFIILSLKVSRNYLKCKKPGGWASQPSFFGEDNIFGQSKGAWFTLITIWIAY